MLFTLELDFLSFVADFLAIVLVVFEAVFLAIRLADAILTFSSASGKA